MSSIILTLVICAVSLLLVYDYFVGKRQRNRLQAQIRALEHELSHAHNHEQELEAISISQKQQLQQVFEDEVTGMLGWQLFQDRINQSIKNSERHKLSLGVLIIDIDDFSIINEAFGLEVGNSVLSEIGSRIQTCLRQVDSACRISRDMFAVLLTQVSKPETAVIVAQRILQSIAAPITVKSYQLHLTACIGLAVFPQDGADAKTLMTNAEHAMRSAKEQGRQVYQFYQENIQARSQRELLLCTGLASDTIFQELALRYQPIVDVRDESILCLNVIPNWHHRELGLISSSELYHYADRQGKLNGITEWLLQQACRQFTHWQSLGLNPKLLGVKLNIKQLENSNFIYRLSLIMQEAGFNPENLLFVISDNGVATSFDILEKAFNMLKYLGVKIGVNNFGTGGISLRYLKYLTVSYVNLEPILVDDIALNERGRLLIKSIIQFANVFSIQVIAQGIDYQAQKDVLTELGCVFMQGKLLGDALADEEVLKVMNPDKVDA